MDDALRRAGWICIAVIAAAYMTFVGTDRIFNANTATSTPIVIRDVLQKNQHHLYGKIVVPKSCDEVSLNVQNSDQSDYQLVFTTWEEPEVACTRDPTERVFDTIIFAPSIGVHFSATIDKVPIPVAVYPSVVNI